jgi:hypothetical protein
MTAVAELAGLIEDIQSAVRAGALMRPAALIIGEQLHVIDDFTQAQDYAFRRYLTDAEDADNWTDLRKREVSRLLAATYSDPARADLRVAVRALDEPFARALAQQLPPAYQPVLDDVAADLQNIALSRAVPGAGTGLFGLMWDVYQRGGWPCGWEGAYPDGRLVVFQPPSGVGTAG